MVEHSRRLKWFRPSCVRPETGDQTKNRLMMAVFGEKGRDDKKVALQKYRVNTGITIASEPNLTHLQSELRPTFRFCFHLYPSPIVIFLI
jgi:hypothetical protein